MSGKEMASDINKAIASGGYVIVTEKAIDGTGRNAIYVYMTYNGKDGYQSWKISGGLNGGMLDKVSAILDLASVIALQFHQGDTAQAVIDSKLLKVLGKVFWVFGFTLSIAELWEDCGPSFAVTLGAGLAGISYFLGFASVGIIGFLPIALPVAIATILTMSLVVIPWFMKELTTTIQNVCSADIWKKIENEMYN